MNTKSDMRSKDNSRKEEAVLQNQAHHMTDLTIMMVDDEVSTMEIVQAYLEDVGYRNFIQVQDSSRAMDMIEEKRPDILLLDLIMPETSGFVVISAIRSHPKFKHLPIIVLTVSTEPMDKLRALELGATDFLAKPVDPSELCLRVRNTLAAKAYQDHLAYYDRVTSLPNRHLFLDRLDWALNKAERYKEQLALLNIALDNFDRINATIGTNAADEVLSQIAERIRSEVRNSDLLGSSFTVEEQEINLFRVEGGAFSLLLERVDSEENAAVVAERIIEVIRKPLQVEGKDIYVKASIGIATYPTESEDRDSLLQLASSARDYIKNRGGDAFQFSSRAINELYTKRRSIEVRLRDAIEQDEFVLFYQPKVDVKTGVIKGVETLLRWKDDENNFIPPEDFIPVAEETGLIVPIGEWILNKAVAQLTTWHQTGRVPIGMSINLSAKQFQNKEFFSIVKRIVDKSSVDPRFMTLEITESLLIKDIEHAIGTLRRFREMGLMLSIDDFGTGYSSLKYLSEFPVDELKIEKSFIVDLPDKASSCNIVSTIIFLSHKLDLLTVAEGVETEAQLRFLQKEQCHQYQGYLFSQPLSDTELLNLIPHQT